MNGEKEFRSDPVFLYNVARTDLRLSSGQPSRPVDVIFFHNHAYGDYTGLYELTKAMYRGRRARFIAVTNNEGERFGGTEKFEANPGKTECIRILTQEQHIPKARILVPDMEARHTREENRAFVDLSIQQSWRSAVILGQPHRLLRFMLGLVQEIDTTGYLMEVYTAAPSFTPWLEVVRGSQGAEEKPRIERIDDELDRVYRYQASRELATFEQLFTYLTIREKGALLLPDQKGESHGLSHI